MIIQCVDNMTIERHGFLWLKKRPAKIVGLTSGKGYEFIRTEEYVYDHPLFPQSFSYVLIIDDRGIPQLHEEHRFRVYRDRSRG